MHMANYTMWLSDNKPEILAKGVVWVQHMAQAVECIQAKGVPNHIILAFHLGKDLFGESLPTGYDFLNVLKHKFETGEWAEPIHIRFEYEDAETEAELSQWVKQWF